MKDLFRKEAIEQLERRLEGEVIAAVPLRSGLLTGLILIAVACLIALACTMSFAQTQTVQGAIIPPNGLVRVVARSTGTIEKMNAAEGMPVRYGAEMAVVRLSGFTRAEGGQPAEDTEAMVADAINIQSQAAQAKSGARRQTLLAERRRIDAQIEAGQLRLAGLRTKIAAKTEALALATADYERLKSLADRGYATAKDLALRRTAMLDAQAALTEAQAEHITIVGDIRAQNSLIAGNDQDELGRQADLADAKAQFSQKLFELQTSSREIVTAPITGTVAALLVAPGQSVKQDDLIAVLLPAGQDLQAELYIPARAIGFAHVGQRVRILYDAFPHEKFGFGEGKIVSLSKTIIRPSDAAYSGQTLKEPVFRARVALKSVSIKAYGQNIALQPGMTVTADIITDRRSVLEWLLDPLFAAGRYL